MKVICIDAGYKSESASSGKTAYALKEGSVYTVIDTITTNGILGYLLAEVKSRTRSETFLASRFAPLSSICETELLAERESTLTTV